ncbi:hypothetical protein DKX38_006896 [Salix brachista]|uniref:Uncharacterized protein n=1 Tax=Salix brachista TaxID=2182728 RepID=A0A5N5MLY1_9ROSI|nr:hypothetical protein DKX38_006896 [Salix brachista]
MAAEKVTVGHEEAVEFVRKVQKHMNKEIYKDFVMILCAYSNNRKDVVDVYRDVKLVSAHKSFPHDMTIGMLSAATITGSAGIVNCNNYGTSGGSSS